MQFADMGFSEAQGDLLNVATEFCRDRSPVAGVRALIDSESGFDRTLWDAMADLGWMTIAIPERHGGAGLSLAEIVPVVEQMGRHMLASPFVPTAVVAHAITAGGTDEQRQMWLPKLATGAIATLAVSEPHGDWDLRHLDTVARRVDQGVQISGEKNFVLWADTAEFLLVSAMLEGEPALLMVARERIPPAAFQREAVIDATKRSFRLVLEDIIVPESAVLERPVFSELEAAAILLQSAEMVGGTHTVIDYTLGYLQTRKQFGKLIGEYQALKHPMVDAYIAYEKARSHLYAAAHSHGAQGKGRIALHMAKAAADAAYAFAADRAIQFHGAFGFTHDCDAGLHRRAAIFHASQWGDAAWHREKLAELLLA